MMMTMMMMMIRTPTAIIAATGDSNTTSMLVTVIMRVGPGTVSRDVPQQLQDWAPRPAGSHLARRPPNSEGDRWGQHYWGHCNFYVFWRTFWVLPLSYGYLPKSARAYLFPQSVKIHYFWNFCSGLISVDPTCPQPTTARLLRKRRETGPFGGVCPWATSAPDRPS